MQRCVKCNSLMPDGVMRCIRCGIEQKQLDPVVTAKPLASAVAAPASQPALPLARSRFSWLGWRLWWTALAFSCVFLVAPPYVLRALPQARTALLVALGLVVGLGCVALVAGIVRTAKQRKLKAVLLGLAAAVPQFFFIFFLAQLAMSRPDDGLGVVCKAGNCVSVVEAAERGDPDAQFTLAMAYATGRGKPRDETAATEWFKRSARGGHTKGKAFYGMGLYRGIGTVANRGEAVKWLTLAAEEGDREAQSALGAAYYEGGGVQVNYVESEKWWRRAAIQGHASAQFNIGALYFEARGVPKNDDEALKWLMAAAEGGDRSAPEMIVKAGFRWPDDKAKIVERLAASRDIVAAPEVASPKILAWRAEQRAKAEALMARGLDAFDEGKSPLYYAILAVDLDLVQSLLDKGADPNGREKEDSWAPIHAAASAGSFKIAALLIESGAKVDLSSPDVPAPVQIAVGSNSNAVVALLLERGADVESKSRFGGGTLLHTAATHSDNRELIELLLKHGAIPNARDGKGKTPLHIAASHTETRTVPVPLGKVPAPPFGRKLEIVQALIKGGADPTLKDISGRTAADYAKVGADGGGVPQEARPRFESILATLKTGK